MHCKRNNSAYPGKAKYSLEHSYRNFDEGSNDIQTIWQICDALIYMYSPGAAKMYLL